MFKTNIKYFDTVDSTNKKALTLAMQGATEGTIIVAEKQTEGRGRKRRVWQSPIGGGLWCSIILRPQIQPEFGAQITLLTGVAVAKALAKLSSNEQILIKWPNDILYQGKKICGILAELTLDIQGRIEYAIVGIGVNVNMSEKDFKEPLAEIATSLYLITGKHYRRREVLAAILKEFEELYLYWLQYGFEKIRQQWLRQNCIIDQIISIKDNEEEIFCGKAQDMDDYGNLLVCSADGVTETFNFGEVSIRSS